MSWNIVLIGTPEKVVNALNEHSTKITGDSKTEFDAALPHLVGLVKENFSVNPFMVKFSANGHGWANERNCTVNLERLVGTLV